MKNQITKETVYRIPADTAGKASASEIHQYSPRGWEKLLVQCGEISADSGRIQLYSFKHDERHRIIRVCGGRRDSKS